MKAGRPPHTCPSGVRTGVLGRRETARPALSLAQKSSLAEGGGRQAAAAGLSCPLALCLSRQEAGAAGRTWSGTAARLPARAVPDSSASRLGVAVQGVLG